MAQGKRAGREKRDLDPVTGGRMHSPHLLALKAFPKMRENRGKSTKTTRVLLAFAAR